MDLGTLDLLAQRTICHYGDPSIPAPIVYGDPSIPAPTVLAPSIPAEGIQGFSHFSHPVFLQAGNASCLYGAVERSIQCLSAEKIAELASKIPFGMIQECPDACTVNGRKKAKSFEQLPANVFGMDGTCGTSGAILWEPGSHIILDCFA